MRLKKMKIKLNCDYCKSKYIEVLEDEMYICFKCHKWDFIGVVQDD